MSLTFVRKDPIYNTSALTHVTAWHRTGDKPLSEPPMVQFIDAYKHFTAGLTALTNTSLLMIRLFAAFQSSVIHITMRLNFQNWSLNSLCQGLFRWTTKKRSKHNITNNLCGVNHRSSAVLTKTQLCGKCIHIMMTHEVRHSNGSSEAPTLHWNTLIYYYQRFVAFDQQNVCKLPGTKFEIGDMLSATKTT